MEDFVVSANVLNAEMKKSLKVVMFYFSFCSCERIGNLFTYMFSDSETAKKFSLGRTNCSYLILALHLILRQSFTMCRNHLFYCII